MVGGNFETTKILEKFKNNITWKYEKAKSFFKSLSSVTHLSLASHLFYEITGIKPNQNKTGPRKNERKKLNKPKNKSTKTKLKQKQANFIKDFLSNIFLININKNTT